MTTSPAEYPDAAIENLEFLADHGTAAPEAARRTGFTTASNLERWLTRQRRYDIWARLKRNGPET